MRLELGAGDGRHALRLAKANPRDLVLATDANLDALKETSRRAPANLLCGHLPLEQAPGVLHQFADQVTILLPWGSLLGAVACPDENLAEIAKIRALLKPTGEVRILFGYSASADPGLVKELRLPPLTPERLRALERAYAEAGFSVKARPFGVEELKATPSTWAKKLAYGGKERAFVALSGKLC